MKQNAYVMVFLLVIFAIMVWALAKPVVVGRATALTGEICSVNQGCEEGVCCNFYGKVYGVCDVSENCDQIKEVTKKNELPNVKINNYNPTIFYSVLIGLFIALFVVVFVFFKKSKN